MENKKTNMIACVIAQATATVKPVGLTTMTTTMTKSEYNDDDNSDNNDNQCHDHTS